MQRHMRPVHERPTRRRSFAVPRGNHHLILNDALLYRPLSRRRLRPSLRLGALRWRGCARGRRLRRHRRCTRSWALLALLRLLGRDRRGLPLLLLGWQVGRRPVLARSPRGGWSAACAAACGDARGAPAADCVKVDRAEGGGERAARLPCPPVVDCQQRSSHAVRHEARRRVVEQGCGMAAHRASREGSDCCRRRRRRRRCTRAAPSHA